MLPPGFVSSLHVLPWYVGQWSEWEYFPRKNAFTCMVFLINKHNPCMQRALIKACMFGLPEELYIHVHFQTMGLLVICCFFESHATKAHINSFVGTSLQLYACA